MVALQTELLKCLHRQEQAARRGREGYETIAVVEGSGAVVLGIDDDGVDRDRDTRPGNAADGVEQQELAKPAAPVPEVDCQPSNHDRRNGIMRQPLRQVRRKFVLLEACRAQCVESGDFLTRFACRDEDLRNAPPGVLRGLATDVAVEGGFPARERRAVVPRTERLDDEGRLIHGLQGVFPSLAPKGVIGSRRILNRHYRPTRSR